MSVSPPTSWPEYGEGYWEHGEGSNYVRYADDPGWGPTVEVLAGFVPAGAMLLEVACAKGYFVRAARQVGFDARGIDLSAWATTHCAPGVEPYVQQANAVEVPFPDSTFDVTVSWEFLEHVPEDRLVDVFEEIVRVTRPYGLVVHRIGTLEAEEDRSQHLHDHTHVTNHDRTWWETRLREAGFAHRRPDVESAFDLRFAGRDWAGRYFAYEI